MAGRLVGQHLRHQVAGIDVERSRLAEMAIARPADRRAALAADRRHLARRRIAGVAHAGRRPCRLVVDPIEAGERGCPRRSGASARSPWSSAPPAVSATITGWATRTGRPCRHEVSKAERVDRPACAVRPHPVDRRRDVLPTHRLQTRRPATGGRTASPGWSKSHCRPCSGEPAVQANRRGHRGEADADRTNARAHGHAVARMAWNSRLSWRRAPAAKPWRSSEILHRIEIHLLVRDPASARASSTPLGEPSPSPGRSPAPRSSRSRSA